MKSRIAKLVLLLGLCVISQGCSTTNVALQYQQSAGASYKSLPPAQVGSFTDRREKSGTQLGAIRSGWGTPLKTLTLERPASEVVAQVLSDALKARQALSDSAGTTISGTILKLDCSQYVKREAHAQIEVVVTRAGSQVFKRTYSHDEVSGSAFALDTAVFASVEDLRVVAEQALVKLVDKVLSDADFIRALR